MKEHWIVNPDESGLKLVDFLKRHLDPTLSSRHIKKCIENNACTINDRIERFASAAVGQGDTITFISKEQPYSTPIDRSRLLFEDHDLFIINKPSGIASDDPQLLRALHHLSPQLLLVHRLDKETSGALIFAKSTEMREKMIHLFRQKKVEKTYLALVDGIPTQKSGIIDNYLGKLHSYEGQALWGPVDSKQGQHARTEWQLQQAGKEAAVLVCKPITGRTHQIRVHLSGIGHPILGDYQYGRRFRCSCHPNRCMLHAYRLAFIHPITGSEIRLEAPVPEDMQKVMGEIF